MNDRDEATQRYEQVRRALLERGYLEPPLERLFLSGAGGGRGRGRLFGAIFAGLISGPVLGLLLAATVVAEGNGLVPWWPDGALYALAFSALLAPIVALIEALAILLIRIGSRRGGIAPRNAAWWAGLLTAGVFAAYFGWWRLRSGGSFNGRELISLLAIMAAAVITGRIISAAAFVETLLSSPALPQLKRPRLWGALIALTLMVTLILGAFSVLAARPAGEQAVEYKGKLGEQSVFVGWDGLSREWARGLVRQSRLPWVGALLERGAVVLERGTQLDPVSLWTTVATGCPAEIHGLSGASLPGVRGASSPSVGRGLASHPLELLARLLPGKTRLARAGVRQIPALWELTADVRKTAVIGWWATWPASSPGAAGGYLVSDAALLATSARSQIDRAIYPTSWGESREAGWMERALATAGAEPADRSDRGAQFAWEALVGDLYLIEAAADARRDPELGALFLYLPGLDIVRERWRGLDKDELEVAAAIERHAALIDTRLAALFPLSASSQVALVLLPGRVGLAESGWFLGAGEHPKARVESLAPAWLAHSGYTIDARICSAGWEVEAAPRPLTRVKPAKAEPVSGAFEQELLERLKSLGYVQ